MLRILKVAGAVALSAFVAGIASAQDVPSSGLILPEASPTVADGDTNTTAPSDSPSAADDPLGAARSAIARARTLTGSQAFKAGVDRQRAGLSALDGQPVTHPQFDVSGPAPLSRPSTADLMQAPARQWAADNRQPLLILVSFAMPDSELRELATQAARIGAPLVLRGFVDNSFAATQKRLMSFRQIHGASWHIDPTLYRRFGVEQVPTFILPLEALQTCSTASCPAPAHISVSGDAGLDYVLDEIDRRSDDPRAQALAQQLQAQLTSDGSP